MAVLESDLRALSAEARRRYPAVKDGAEHAILKVKLQCYALFIRDVLSYNICCRVTSAISHCNVQNSAAFGFNFSETEVCGIFWSLKD